MKYRRNTPHANVLTRPHTAQSQYFPAEPFNCLMTNQLRNRLLLSQHENIRRERSVVLPASPYYTTEESLRSRKRDARWAEILAQTARIDEPEQSQFAAPPSPPQTSSQPEAERFKGLTLSEEPKKLPRSRCRAEQSSQNGSPVNLSQLPCPAPPPPPFIQTPCLTAQPGANVCPQLEDPESLLAFPPHYATNGPRNVSPVDPFPPTSSLSPSPTLLVSVWEQSPGYSEPPPRPDDSKRQLASSPCRTNVERVSPIARLPPSFFSPLSPISPMSASECVSLISPQLIL